MITRPEALALPHPAYRWLCGIILQWNGHNNGALEFQRHKHGSAQGLGDRKVFERARQQVLDTRLVEMVREGGRNLPTLYALTLLPYQISPQILGGRQPPTNQKILGGLEPPTEVKTQGFSTPKLGVGNPQGNPPALKNARASDYGNDKSQTDTHALTDSQCWSAANPEWPGEAKSAEGAGTPEPASLNGAADLPRTGSLER
jgi:hypothetical protein